jgi:electron transport complex protein RnfE
MNKFKVLTNGIIKENPILILVLGACPTLATTTSAENGMWMGLATMFVLICSNMAISAIRNIVPDKVRIPVFVVVIASFVTIVDMAMQAYVPAIYDKLGLFIPLIVVNCIVLGRAEAFASKNGIGMSALDGIGMGLGFTFALTLLGSIREILGNFSIFDLKFIENDGILVFVLAPGAFFGLALLIALLRKVKIK